MQITRRCALLSLSAGAVRAQARRELIDAHVHFYDPSRPQGVPWPPKSDAILYRTTLPARFVALTQPLGVTGAVVVEASPLLEDNQWVLDLARDNPVIVGVVGHLDPMQPEFRDHLARFTKNPLFRGIRLNERAIATGIGGKDFMVNMRRLADAGLSLDAIGSSAMAANLITLTEAIPALRIIVNHMPLDAPTPEFGAHPMIYSKVSGVLQNVNGRVPLDVESYRGSLDQLWTTFGPRRVVYASNWPVSDRMAPYASVLHVVKEYVEAKGAHQAELFFSKNASDVYQWVARK